MENFDGLKEDLARHWIECDFEEPGELAVAVADHQVEGLLEGAELLRDYGHDVEVLERAALRAAIALPTYQAAVGSDRRGARRPGQALRRARASDHVLGVEVFERTPVTSLQDARRGDRADDAGGSDQRPKGDPGDERLHPVGPLAPPLPGPRLRLRTRQRAARRGAARGGRLALAAGDQRLRQPVPLLPADRRRPDPLGRLRGRLPLRRPGRCPLRHRRGDVRALAQNFFATFPQLRGLRFSHRWGGAIDTCSRFSSFFDLSHGGKVAFVGGYTGLGVGSSRFGAEVALDLVDGNRTEATELDYVRKPFPFPPEPIRWAVVQFTRRRLAAADRNHGRRGLWLRPLDRLGLGFDS